jgi:hypothetical protein
MLDRVADVLHQVSRASLQTIHTQTLLIRNQYLKQFKTSDMKVEEQLRLRDSTLFSSQVFPTQDCFVALRNTRASLALDQQDAISISLKRMSQSFGTAGKGGPPVNPNQGNNNTGGGRGNARKRNRSASWGRKRNRSNSAKRPYNGGGNPQQQQQRKEGGFQQGPSKGNFNNTPGKGRGRGRGRGRGGPQGF